MSIPNIREDFKDKIFENFFDFSTLDDDDEMYDTSRESKIGFWKVESGSDSILSSTGNRPKVYFLQYLSPKMLKDINKRLRVINIEMRKMKNGPKCSRQFKYILKEMKKQKGVYSFTQHKKKRSLQESVLVLCTHSLVQKDKTLS